jgi:hypothetical protein
VAAVGELRQGVGQGLLQQALVGDGKLVGRTHDAAALALDLFAQQQHARRGIEADAQGLDVSGLTRTSSAPASMASRMWASLPGEASSSA